MTELEKMTKGELYYSNDDLLVEYRKKAKKLCYDYNALPFDALSERNEILEKLFNQKIDGACIVPSFYCDYGFNIKIGKNFYSNHNLVILDVANVTFGDNVFIGPNCGFYTAGHPIDYKIRNSGLEYGLPISVGNNVWFGGNVVVLPNVKIGSNVVIGAGSVVTKDIPDNCVAYGNPCKVIKNLD